MAAQVLFLLPEHFVACRADRARAPRTVALAQVAMGAGFGLLQGVGLHQPARLRIMVALYKNRQLGFPALRDELDLTPGNLGAHLEKLEAAGYLAALRAMLGL